MASDETWMYGLASAGRSAPRDLQLTPKVPPQRPPQNSLAFREPQGLSNPGWSFSPKKSACGKLDSSNRACQIQGWSFSPKKSACGKIPISNRACQIQFWLNPVWDGPAHPSIPAHPCIPASQKKTSQQPAGGRQLSRLLLRQDRCLLLRQDR